MGEPRPEVRLATALTPRRRAETLPQVLLATPGAPLPALVPLATVRTPLALPPRLRARLPAPVPSATVRTRLALPPQLRPARLPARVRSATVRTPLALPPRLRPARPP